MKSSEGLHNIMIQLNSNKKDEDWSLSVSLKLTQKAVTGLSIILLSLGSSTLTLAVVHVRPPVVEDTSYPTPTPEAEQQDPFCDSQRI
jgi:hypothetical protein